MRVIIVISAMIKGHQHIVVNRNICSNCHNMKIIVFDRTALPSKFDHEAHAKMFNCKDCHPNIFLMSAGATRVTMKDIYSGAYCGACHDGKKAFASSECVKCHNKMKGFEKELSYKVEGMGNVVFSHKFHTTAFSCDSCHPKLFDMKKTQGKMKMDDMYQGKTCGSCHNGNIATAVTDCGKCHKG
ncbi:cytochrome C [hot springs metagenome]|uniref:Cytochrome C n=1 Tax=hot springs metagenome TaxID=433727 RepID=A0A5J4KYZ6_9ZZZZ